MTHRPWKNGGSSCLVEPDDGRVVPRNLDGRLDLSHRVSTVSYERTIEMSWGTYDETKTEELILYVASRTESDETAGRTKLHKILYFSDRANLVEHGSTITDGDYQRAPQGPTLRRMLPLLDKLEESGAAKTVERIYFGKKQKKVVALRDPDLSMFSPEEIASVDLTIHQFWGKSAKETSDIAHEDAGWIAADDGGSIHMQMAFIEDEPELTEDIRQRAKKLAEKHS